MSEPVLETLPRLLKELLELAVFVVAPEWLEEVVYALVPEELAEVLGRDDADDEE